MRSAILIVLTIFVSGCAATPVSQADPNPTAPDISTPTTNLTPTVPTATPTATATSTATLLPTSTPAETNTPTPTATLVPPLRQLTAGGCCVHPLFSPDPEQVLFIDKPAENLPAGIYGVDVDQQVPDQSKLINETIGFRNQQRNIVATINDDVVQFIDEATGDSWELETGGNWPHFSPDSTQVLWTATDREGPYDRRQSDIWLANLDGSDPRRVISLYGGGFTAWFPDGERILLIGRDRPEDEDRMLISLNLTDGQRVDLASQKRIRNPKMSPDGGWIVYFVDFADEVEDRGVWAVSSDGMTRKKLNFPAFGAYNWRDDDTLLIIPMRDNPEESMQVWSLDVPDNVAVPLTDPASVKFVISNGDWTVSPNGDSIAFVNSDDKNIWLLTLPEE